jgi:hypothetical protein
VIGCFDQIIRSVTRTFSMPHAEVPFERFWTDSLGSTLASVLTLSGCPNP